MQGIIADLDRNAELEDFPDMFGILPDLLKSSTPGPLTTRATDGLSSAKKVK
jgi:hypothetical protein